MRPAAALLLATLAASPAEARCFSVWHYNYPQPCIAKRASLQKATSAGVVPTPPQLTDDELRARAIEALKAQLGSK